MLRFLCPEMLMHERRCVVGHLALEEFHRARHYAKMATLHMRYLSTQKPSVNV